MMHGRDIYIDRGVDGYWGSKKSREQEVNIRCIYSARGGGVDRNWLQCRKQGNIMFSSAMPEKCKNNIVTRR